MTKKEAIHILIEHAAKDCVGSGCGGGHVVPSWAETLRVVEAIQVVWPEKHYPPNWFNMGLPDPRISGG